MHCIFFKRNFNSHTCILAFSTKQGYQGASHPFIFQILIDAESIKILSSIKQWKRNREFTIVFVEIQNWTKIKKFPLCHAWPLKKHGPDRFIPFDVYLTQTYRQTPWQEKYIGRCWSLFFRLLDLFCSFLFAELLVVEMLSFKKKKNLDILNSYFSRYRCKLGITVCALRITWNYATVPKSQ